MKAIQRIRRMFGFDPKLTRQQLTHEMMKKVVKMSAKGHVEVWSAGHRVLEEVLSDHDKRVFLLVINAKYIPKPKPLKEWFDDQVTNARLEFTDETE
jgi:hypothetical protein